MTFLRVIDIPQEFRHMFAAKPYVRRSPKGKLVRVRGYVGRQRKPDETRSARARSSYVPIDKEKRHTAFRWQNWIIKELGLSQSAINDEALDGLYFCSKGKPCLAVEIKARLSKDARPRINMSPASRRHKEMTVRARKIRESWTIGVDTTRGASPIIYARRGFGAYMYASMHKYRTHELYLLRDLMFERVKK